MLLFLHYPGCDTCRKARKWLVSRGIPFLDRHIVDEPPTVEELEAWMALGNIPAERLFNTSGLSYRALGLKDRLNTLTLPEKLTLLAADGKLVKRPLLVAQDGVLAGFRETEWAAFVAKHA